MSQDVTWSVAQVAELASVAVEQAFGGPIWVEGEICNLSRSARGHVYFTLIEPGADATSADIQLRVTLFDWNRQKVNLQIRRSGGGLRMTDGIKVRIRGNVELYAARSQLQMRMIAIDPTYTLGNLEAARAALLAKLLEAGLLGANAAIPVPMLPLRIALVTSLGSAAHADFRHEIDASAIAFELVEIDTRVQGAEADFSVPDALAEAAESGVDVICVVRGGGARTDLAAFDTEAVAVAIASTPLPVWVGIGHEIDRTVADEVAHSSFKTPTACAAALVAAVRDAAVLAEETWAAIAQLARRRLDRSEAQMAECTRRVARAAVVRTEHAGTRLDHQATALRRTVQHRLEVADRRLDLAAANVVTAGPRRLRAAERDLAAIEAQVHALDPARIVERGWSLTRRADGTVVRSTADVADGDELVTRLADGDVRSTVTGVEATT